MKKIISIALALLLVAAMMLALVSCFGDEEETGHNIIIEEPDEVDSDNETAKKPDGTAETENWELGAIPLD